MDDTNKISRRGFLKSSSVAGLYGVLGTTGAVAAASSLTSCDKKEKNPFIPLKKPEEYYIPALTDMAIDGKPLKAGIIGCGGRGSGAAFNFLEAANDVTITALGDVFQDRLNNLRNDLKSAKDINIPAENCFTGLDAFQKVIDSDVDVVIVATPPVFRPEHFRYAVEKGKHAFLEKPLCVDPVGYRTIMAASRQATAKKLSVVTGTQRHHERKYVESYKKIMEGYIGEITGGTVYWNSNMLWFRNREKGWTDAECMIRDWVNWKWLSGDHIVEQHIHNLDVFMWFSGLKPAKCVGIGSRQRRLTGDQYDNFSVDFIMENGIHLHSICRQIDGCANNVSEFIQGSRGSWSSNGGCKIKDLAGNIIWAFDEEAEKEQFQQTNPFTLEHIDWISHIRSGKPINVAEETLVSNLAAIMGREAAYTGTETSWDTMMAAPMDCMPSDFSLKGKMNMKQFTVPVPGQ